MLERNLDYTQTSRWDSSLKTEYYNHKSNTHLLADLINPHAFVDTISKIPTPNRHFRDRVAFGMYPQIVGVPAIVLFDIKSTSNPNVHDIVFYRGVIEGRSNTDIIALPKDVFLKTGVPKRFKDTGFFSQQVKADNIHIDTDRLAVRGVLALDKRNRNRTYDVLFEIFGEETKFTKVMTQDVAKLYTKADSGVGRTERDEKDLLEDFYASLSFVPTDIYECNTKKSNKLARPMRMQRSTAYYIIGREFSKYADFHRPILVHEPGYPKPIERLSDKEVKTFKKRVDRSTPFSVYGVLVRPDDPEQVSSSKGWIIKPT